MSQINDQAAKEAAELLPCWCGDSDLNCQAREHVQHEDCPASFRLPVAERLRQRDKQIEHWREARRLAIAGGDMLKERIAALEKDVKDLTADVSSRGETIIALEAENEMLLKRLDDAQNGEGALIRENERLRHFAENVPHLLPLNDKRHAYIVAAHAPSIGTGNEEELCARLGGRCAALAGRGK